MFLPEIFRVVDSAEIFAFIENNGFGMLVSAGDNSEDMPFVSPLPMMIDDGVLYGHLARINPHWRLFDGKRVAQAIFSGPHGYVSPRWFPDPAKAVPTWNYVLARVTGCPEVLEDEARISTLMRRLSQQYEGEGGWSPDQTDPDFMAGMRRGIIAFEMRIEGVDGKAKLSQNKNPDIAAEIADRLEAGGNSDLAQAMRRNGNV